MRTLVRDISDKATRNLIVSVIMKVVNDKLLQGKAQTFCLIGEKDSAFIRGVLNHHLANIP